MTCPQCGEPLAGVGEGGLTPQQNRLWRAIAAHVDEHGISPSYDDLKARLGLASKSGIARLLDQLEDRGFISRVPNRIRSMQLLQRPVGGRTVSDSTIPADPMRGAVENGRAWSAKCQWKGAAEPFWFGTVFVRLNAPHQEIEAEVKATIRTILPPDVRPPDIVELAPGTIVFMPEDE
jgi:repressor LexA